MNKMSKRERGKTKELAIGNFMIAISLLLMSTEVSTKFLGVIGVVGACLYILDGYRYFKELREDKKIKLMEEE